MNIVAEHRFDCYGPTQGAEFCPCGADELNAELTRLRAIVADVQRVSNRLRAYRGGFCQIEADRADTADVIDAALAGNLPEVMRA